MSVKLGSTTFKCGDIHGAPNTKKPKHHTTRRFQFGRRLVTERTGGSGEREITIRCWINDSTFTSYKALDDYLKTLDQLIGENGELVVVFNSESISYPTTTFNGADRRSRIVQDFAGLVNSTPNTYWLEVILGFTQLRY